MKACRKTVDLLKVCKRIFLICLIKSSCSLLNPKKIIIPYQLKGSEHNRLCYILDRLLLFQLRFSRVFACGLEFLQESLLQCFVPALICASICVKTKILPIIIGFYCKQSTKQLIKFAIILSAAAQARGYCCCLLHKWDHRSVEEFCLLRGTIKTLQAIKFSESLFK